MVLCTAAATIDASSPSASPSSLFTLGRRRRCRRRPSPRLARGARRPRGRRRARGVADARRRRRRRRLQREGRAAALRLCRRRRRRGARCGCGGGGLDLGGRPQVDGTKERPACAGGGRGRGGGRLHLGGRAQIDPAGAHRRQRGDRRRRGRRLAECFYRRLLVVVRCGAAAHRAEHPLYPRRDGVADAGDPLLPRLPPRLRLGLAQLRLLRLPLPSPHPPPPWPTDVRAPWPPLVSPSCAARTTAGEALDEEDGDLGARAVDERGARLALLAQQHAALRIARHRSIGPQRSIARHAVHPIVDRRRERGFAAAFDGPGAAAAAVAALSIMFAAESSVPNERCSARLQEERLGRRRVAVLVRGVRLGDERVVLRRALLGVEEDLRLVRLADRRHALHERARLGELHRRGRRSAAVSSKASDSSRS